MTLPLPLNLPLPLPPPQCVVNTFVFVVIAIIHCVYSFIIPFIYRIVFIDEDNWTLRFQVITVRVRFRVRVRVRLTLTLTLTQPQLGQAPGPRTVSQRARSEL